MGLSELRSNTARKDYSQLGVRDNGKQWGITYFGVKEEKNKSSPTPSRTEKFMLACGINSHIPPQSVREYDAANEIIVEEIDEEEEARSNNKEGNTDLIGLDVGDGEAEDEKVKTKPIFRVRRLVSGEMVDATTDGEADCSIIGLRIKEARVNFFNPASGLTLITPLHYARQRGSACLTTLIRKEDKERFPDLDALKGHLIASEYPNIAYDELIARGWKPSDILLWKSLGDTENKPARKRKVRLPDGRIMIIDAAIDVAETFRSAHDAGLIEVLKGRLMRRIPFWFLGNTVEMVDEDNRERMIRAAGNFLHQIALEQGPLVQMIMNARNDMLPRVTRLLRKYSLKKPNVLANADEKGVVKKRSPDEFTTLLATVQQKYAEALENYLIRVLGVQDINSSNVLKHRPSDFTDDLFPCGKHWENI